MIAECYDLALQCDFHPQGAYRESFQGKTRGEAHKFAREEGWRIYAEQHLAKCKFCVSDRRTKVSGKASIR